MKISLAVLLVFGLAAVITALPATQDEFEVEQPNLEEQDIPGKYIIFNYFSFI